MDLESSGTSCVILSDVRLTGSVRHYSSIANEQQASGSREKKTQHAAGSRCEQNCASMAHPTYENTASTSIILKKKEKKTNMTRRRRRRYPICDVRREARERGLTRGTGGLEINLQQYTHLSLTPALERLAHSGASVAPSHVDGGHRAADTGRIGRAMGGPIL